MLINLVADKKGAQCHLRCRRVMNRCAAAHCSELPDEPFGRVNHTEQSRVYEIQATFRQQNRIPAGPSWARLPSGGHLLAARHNENYDHYKHNSRNNADRSWIHRSTLLKIYAAQISLQPLPHITEQRPALESKSDTKVL